MSEDYNWITIIFDNDLRDVAYGGPLIVERYARKTDEMVLALKKGDDIESAEVLKENNRDAYEETVKGLKKYLLNGDLTLKSYVMYYRGLKHFKRFFRLNYKTMKKVTNK